MVPNPWSSVGWQFSFSLCSHHLWPSDLCLRFFLSFFFSPHEAGCSAGLPFEQNLHLQPCGPPVQDTIIRFQHVSTQWETKRNKNHGQETCGIGWVLRSMIFHASFSDSVNASAFLRVFLGSIHVPGDAGLDPGMTSVFSRCPFKDWNFSRFSFEVVPGEASGFGGGRGTAAPRISTKGWVSTLSPHAPGKTAHHRIECIYELYGVGETWNWNNLLKLYYFWKLKNSPEGEVGLTFDVAASAARFLASRILKCCLNMIMKHPFSR